MKTQAKVAVNEDGTYFLVFPEYDSYVEFLLKEPVWWVSDDGNTVLLLEISENIQLGYN